MTSNDRGLGGTPADPAETKRHLTVIRQAVFNGWDLPNEASRRLPADLQAIVDDPMTSTRDRIRALECLAALRKDRFDAAVQLDRIQRLEDGSVTDRVEVAQVVTDEQLAAVARAIAGKPTECPPKPKPRRKPR